MGAGEIEGQGSTDPHGRAFEVTAICRAVVKMLSFTQL